MLNAIVLISVPDVLALPIHESGDSLIDLKTVDDIIVDPRKSEDSVLFSKIRKSVAEKLLEAQKHLPVGVRFLVIEGYRPLALQKEYFDGYSRELREAHPDWNAEKIYAESSKYVAPPEIIPPHSTGGAVDLTLSKDGAELDMGTRVNADPEESHNACFTGAETISEAAKANRKMLIDALTSVGFVNYPTEWWHWSYGDRYWAFQTKRENAIFGSV